VSLEEKRSNIRQNLTTPDGLLLRGSRLASEIILVIRLSLNESRRQLTSLGQVNGKVRGWPTGGLPSIGILTASDRFDLDVKEGE